MPKSRGKIFCQNFCQLKNKHTVQYNHFHVIFIDNYHVIVMLRYLYHCHAIYIDNYHANNILFVSLL